MADKVDSKIENKVGVAVADAVSELPDMQTDEENKKLDERAELFVRRVSDEVTRAIANLVKPPVADTPPEPIVDEVKTKKKVQQKLTILDWLLS